MPDAQSLVSDCAPSCVQCRSPIFVALCEPDFNNPALMPATYACSVCGLRDRAPRTEAIPFRFLCPQFTVAGAMTAHAEACGICRYYGA